MCYVGVVFHRAGRKMISLWCLLLFVGVVSCHVERGPVGTFHCGLFCCYGVVCCGILCVCVGVRRSGWQAAMWCNAVCGDAELWNLRCVVVCGRGATCCGVVSFVFSYDVRDKRLYCGVVGVFVSTGCMFCGAVVPHVWC